MSDDGSGRRSLQAWQARTLRSTPACRRLSEQDGSGRQAACHQRSLDSRQSRSPGDIFHWRSGSRSRSFACRAIPCRRFARGLGRAASTISRELRRDAATRSGGLEYRATTAQWRVERSARRPNPGKLVRNAALRNYVEERDWLASPSLRAGLLFPARPCPGKDVGMDRGRSVGGPGHGARSRLLAACRSIPGRWDDAYQPRS